MNVTNTNGGPDGQTPNGTTPTGQTPTTTPQGQTPNGRTSIDSLPTDIQEMISSLRTENKEKREKLAAQESARQQSEQEELRKQGEFQKLAEQHEARVKELEPVQERYNKLSERLHEQIKDEVKSWPDEIKALVPDKNIPIEERLVSLSKLRPLVEKFAVQQQGARPGNVPNPSPAGTVGATVDSAMQKLLGSKTYSY